MLSVVISAAIAIAIGAWLFVQRKGEQTPAAIGSRINTEDKRHAVEMAVLKAELAVSSDARAFEYGLQMARDTVAHQAWLAGLTHEERELHSQSVALLEAAVDPAPTISPATATQSAFSPPKSSGDDWIDRQINEAFQQQVVRRRKVIEKTAQSLRSQPKLQAYMREALGKLGRDDLWTELSSFRHLSE